MIGSLFEKTTKKQEELAKRNLNIQQMASKRHGMKCVSDQNFHKNIQNIKYNPCMNSQSETNISYIPFEQQKSNTTFVNQGTQLSSLKEQCKQQHNEPRMHKHNQFKNTTTMQKKSFRELDVDEHNSSLVLNPSFEHHHKKSFNVHNQIPTSKQQFYDHQDCDSTYTNHGSDDESSSLKSSSDTHYDTPTGMNYPNYETNHFSHAVPCHQIKNMLKKYSKDNAKIEWESDQTKTSAYKKREQIILDNEVMFERNIEEEKESLGKSVPYKHHTAFDTRSWSLNPLVLDNEITCNDQYMPFENENLFQSNIRDFSTKSQTYNHQTNMPCLINTTKMDEPKSKKIECNGMSSNNVLIPCKEIHVNHKKYHPTENTHHTIDVKNKNNMYFKPPQHSLTGIEINFDEYYEREDEINYDSYCNNLKLENYQPSWTTNSNHNRWLGSSTRDHFKHNIQNHDVQVDTVFESKHMSKEIKIKDTSHNCISQITVDDVETLFDSQEKTAGKKCNVPCSTTIEEDCKPCDIEPFTKTNEEDKEIQTNIPCLPPINLNFKIVDANITNLINLGYQDRINDVDSPIHTVLNFKPSEISFEPPKTTPTANLHTQTHDDQFNGNSTSTTDHGQSMSPHLHRHNCDNQHAIKCANSTNNGTHKETPTHLCQSPLFFKEFLSMFQTQLQSMSQNVPNQHTIFTRNDISNPNYAKDCQDEYFNKSKLLEQTNQQVLDENSNINSTLSPAFTQNFVPNSRILPVESNSIQNVDVVYNNTLLQSCSSNPISGQACMLGKKNDGRKERNDNSTNLVNLHQRHSSLSHTPTSCFPNFYKRLSKSSNDLHLLANQGISTSLFDVDFEKNSVKNKAKCSSTFNDDRKTDNYSKMYDSGSNNLFESKKEGNAKDGCFWINAPNQMYTAKNANENNTENFINKKAGNSSSLNDTTSSKNHPRECRNSEIPTKDDDSDTYERVLCVARIRFVSPSLSTLSKKM
nr:GATA zinc finger domain-containing protein 14-like [Physcomitrium patens]|eukprot:XP_024403764.1 GATA zinc finger domain-containing protein 14-like [Physcomitrella patens]